MDSRRRLWTTLPWVHLPPPLKPLLLFLGCLSLASCGVIATLAGIGDRDQAQERSECAQGASPNPAQWWRTISSARMAVDPLTIQSPPADLGRRVTLLSPVAVAARDNDVFIADAGQGAILRFDRSAPSVSLFAAAPGLQTGTDLFLDTFQSLYFVDTPSSQVIQFSRNGTVARRYQSSAELPQPNSVVVGPGPRGVYVGDGLRAHIVVFNRLGEITRVIGARAGGPIRFESIAAMAQGEDGRLYVVDRLAHRVHVLAPQGSYQGTFGHNALTTPGAIAVDRYNRVFVSDQGGSKIRIFRSGRLQASLEGAARPFQQIADLWIDSELLYVADMGIPRVEVFHLSAPCP